MTAIKYVTTHLKSSVSFPDNLQIAINKLCETRQLDGLALKLHNKLASSEQANNHHHVHLLHYFLQLFTVRKELLSCCAPATTTNIQTRLLAAC